MRPFTPLYPAPIVDDLAIQHAPNFENKRGNRYAAPRPEQVQAQPATASNTSMSMSRPRLVTDGNKNPLLQIDGPSEAVWQYTMATLSSTTAAPNTDTAMTKEISSISCSRGMPVATA